MNFSADQRRSMLRVILIYAAMASAWIFLSDGILIYFTAEPAHLAGISIVKGLAFVVVTTVLLYVLLQRTWMRHVCALNQNAEMLRLQAMVLDQIQDHVTVTDLNGVVTYVNATELRALQFASGERIGQHVSVYGEGPQADATQQEIVDATLQKGSWKGTVVNYRGGWLLHPA